MNHSDTIKIENGVAKVKMTCSDCNSTVYIDRDKWERYYIEDESDFICNGCQNDILSAPY